MALELQQMGLGVKQQARIHVHYAGRVVGEYFADLLVADAAIVEIKATRQILKEHEAQLLNYLCATPYEVGLLLNFGARPDFRRKVFDNERKPTQTWISGLGQQLPIENLALSAVIRGNPRPSRRSGGVK